MTGPGRRTRLRDSPRVLPVGAANSSAEADTLAPEPRLDDLFDTGEGPAADEQDVGRIDLDEFLVGVLAPPLRWDRGGGAFQNLEQRLLHAFA